MEARRAARAERKRRWWQENFPGIVEITGSEQVDGADDPLAAREELNEALAAAAHAERAVILSHFPPDLHGEVRPWDPADDEGDLFGLVDEGAVRIRRDGAFAVAERYVDGELVAKGMLVHADGEWRWVEDPGE